MLAGVPPVSRVFAIADLHFGHLKVAQLRGFQTTEQHDSALVAAWNSVVTKRDVVYVLGDVFRLERMQELAGMKKLAMGNHDKYPADRYDRHFTRVAAYYEYDGCILSHIPVHPSQFPRYRLNVHGHTHAKVVQELPGGLEDLRYYPVSVEQCPYMRPMVLDGLIQSRLT